MTLLSIVGLASGLLFCVAGLPAAVRAVRSGRSDIPSITTICLWLGLVLGYVYLHAHNGFDPVVVIMYSTEMITWTIVGYYTFWPRKHKFHKFIDFVGENLKQYEQERRPGDRQ